MELFRQKTSKISDLGSTTLVPNFNLVPKFENSPPEKPLAIHSDTSIIGAPYIGMTYMSHLNPSEVHELIGEEAVSNLQKLSAYLKQPTLKARFDMASYAWPLYRYPDAHTECGAVGCAIGHGPHAGVPKQNNETWYCYSRRAFLGQNPKHTRQTEEDAIWDWLFYDRWTYTDNTPQGAAARIDYLLTKGLPEYWRDQMQGYEPLCYEV